MSAVLVSALGAASHAATVPLQNAAAQFSQQSFNVIRAIDGQFPTADAADTGWAIVDTNTGNNFGNDNATFQSVTATPTSQAYTSLHFSLFSGGFTRFGGSHTLGHFRISVTNANPSVFAANGAGVGNETIGGQTIWTPVAPLTATSDNAGVTLNIRPDLSLLTTGPAGALETYDITGSVFLNGITGFRLETLTDPSLPSGGPGRAAQNGNFVLREFTVFATPIPEPSSLVLSAFALISLIAWGVRRKR